MSLLTGALVLLLVTGCVISPRRIIGGSSGGGGTASGGKLYVTSGNSILRFDDALSSSGNVSPGGTLAGNLTQLSSPQGLLIDSNTDRLFVANTGAASVLIFSGASTASGNIAPAATLAGNLTGFSSPIAVAIDTTNNLLYVADQAQILVFTNETGLSGNINAAPAQSFITGFTIAGIALDIPDNILYAADANDNAVSVYQSASAQSGVGFATGTIAGADTGLSRPTGLALDPNGRLVVSNPGSPSVTSYSSPTVATGDTLPSFVINGSSTGLTSPAQIAATGAVTNGALFVSDTNSNAVLVYSPITTVTGTVNLAPQREFSGSSTTLSSPFGLALDTTR